MAEQKRIDFPWSSLQAMIRDCVFPTIYVLEGKAKKRMVPVSMTTAKAVLQIIHGHGGGHEAWLSFDTLAAKTGKSLRQVKRAVAALAGKGWLMVSYRRTPSGVPCNHYRINYNEVGLAVPKKSAIDAEESATSAEESAIPSKPPGGESAIGGTQSTRSRKKRIEGRGSALRNLPDFRGYDFEDQQDIRSIFSLLVEGGFDYSLRDVATAAVTTVRKARPESVTGFFATVLRNPHGEYAPSEQDTAAGKAIADSLMAHRYSRT